MSEQNILNPSATSLFGPDYGYGETLPEMRSVFQARSGNIFSRQQQGLGRVFSFQWNSRDLATKLAFQQWESQYRDDFFSVADWQSGRYFTGRFAAPLVYTPTGNNQWNIQGQFNELPGLPMFAYPSNWARDAVFLYSKNGAGDAIAKLTGTWTLISASGDPRFLSGWNSHSNVTNDIAEWLYFGYGFRYWSSKWPDAGILEYTLTRVRDGSAVAGPTTFDLYANPQINPAALFSVTNVQLDFYRLKLRVTGTKNASSSNTYLYADAVQAMR